MVKNKSENAIKLMKMVSELEGLKDKMNEAIEFLLDSENDNEFENLYIRLIEDKMTELRLIAGSASYEFSQK